VEGSPTCITLRNPFLGADRISDHTCVIIPDFDHRVMKAEKLLKGRGLNVDLIPVPREISSIAVSLLRCLFEMGDEALRLMDEHRIAVHEMVYPA